MTTKELIDKLSKLPPDYEVDVILDFNIYPDPDDAPDFKMDLEEIIGAGEPCTVFACDEHKRVNIITLPYPEMDDVWDVARNISQRRN